MKAKKFIEKKVEGEFELIKNHVIEIDVDKTMIEYICSGYLETGDDPEYDYTNYGVLSDEDGEPAYIKIGKFLEAIDKKAHDSGDEDTLEPDEYQKVQKLKEFSDYELWLK